MRVVTEQANLGRSEKGLQIVGHPFLVEKSGEEGIWRKCPNNRRLRAEEPELPTIANIYVSSCLNRFVAVIFRI